MAGLTDIFALQFFKLDPNKINTNASMEMFTIAMYSADPYKTAITPHAMN